jgi:hypothetical protein
MLMKRYNGTSYPDWEFTPEPVIEELMQVIAGEVDADESRKKSGVQEGEERIQDQAKRLGLPIG